MAWPEAVYLLTDHHRIADLFLELVGFPSTVGRSVVPIG